MSKLNWFYDEEAKTSAYEVMVAGQSFIFLRHKEEEIYIPIHTWRVMMDTWREKKWDPKFDNLNVVDECFSDQ
jgi:hypothetical protein